MDLLTTVGLAVGLAMDATAVAVGTSIALGRVTPRQVFRFAFHFGLFQFFMPVLGWLSGRSFIHYIQAVDHWLVFVLLTAIGAKAMHEAVTPEDGAARERSDPTRGKSLVLLSVATSIDALAVGLSLAMLEVQIWTPCVVIGLVTATLTALGMVVGARLGARLGQRMRFAGGLVLVLVGVKILFAHLAG
ncbi:MAG: manganese efflux pump [Deltaproteobacteria bacterium]|nr:manganese efflux pump [Deltaproteobacteria bacterium]